MTTFSLIFLGLTVLDQASGTLDADQFIRLIHGQHEPIRDVTFLFEGQMRFVGPAQLRTADVSATFTQDFQGTFAWRADGACSIDVYVYGENAVPVTRRSGSLIAGRLMTRYMSPDRDASRVPIQPHGERFDTIENTISPVAFFMPYFFRDYKPQGMDYQFQGWEPVDGHECIVVKVNTFRGPTGQERYYEKYWIDVQRGAHLLKLERYHNDRLTQRIDRVELIQVPSTPGKVWLPVGCVIESFQWKDTFYKEPILRVTNAVVAGTLRLNSGLGDAAFRIDSQALPGSDSLARTRKEFAEFAASAGRRPLRLDRASIQKDLDAKLDEARRQSDLVDASSAAGRPGEWLVPAQYLLIGCGLLLIPGALLWRRRWGR